MKRAEDAREKIWAKEAQDGIETNPAEILGNIN